jgi:hypothetical protein
VIGDIYFSTSVCLIYLSTIVKCFFLVDITKMCQECKTVRHADMCCVYIFFAQESTSAPFLSCFVKIFIFRLAAYNQQKDKILDSKIVSSQIVIILRKFNKFADYNFMHSSSVPSIQNRPCLSSKI